MNIKIIHEESMISLAEFLAEVSYEGSAPRRWFSECLKFNLGISPEYDKYIRYALYIIEDRDGVDYMEIKKEMA